MKALFVSLYADTPHFETELELANDLLDEGAEVHVLRCTGQLGACLKNPEHKELVCRLCVSKIDNGLLTLSRRRLHVSVLPTTVPDPRLPREFASVDELKHFVLDGANLGRGVYSTVCGRAHKDTQLDTRRYAAMIRTELGAAAAVYAAVRDTLARLRPDRVYVFNGRFSTCFAVIEACKQAGVTYLTHERGGAPDRYLLREQALPHDLKLNTAEIEHVWGNGGPDKEVIARSWFEERRAGVERSWESFTKEQAVGRLPDSFEPSRRNIAVFNSTMEEYASIEGWESPVYSDEVVGLRQIVDSLAVHTNVHVYLRVHPHLKQIARQDNYQLREYTELASRAKNLTVIWPESPVHTYALLDHCDVALTFGSTVGVEACFWGKPSVLAGRALYERLDCAYTAANHAGIMRLLLDDKLEIKRQDNALRYSYWETVRGFPYRSFRPTGLYTGDWLGRPNQSSLRARLEYAVRRRLRNAVRGRLGR
jgi:Capsule polysaccharide biosynthesis protein